jgi:serine protease AprX
MKIFAPFLFFLLISAGCLSQVATDHYLVEFTDKNNSPYSIDQPGAYLSTKAIERRTRFNIAITEQDFPVNPQYIQAVKDIGVKYVQQEKWLNAIIIKTSDTSKLSQVNALPFVKKVVKDKLFPLKAEELVVPSETKGPSGNSSTNYGEAFAQISMVGGIPLHDLGFRGQGLSIAVLDGGFTGANFMQAFDSLRLNGQIKGTLNLVGGGTYVYQGTSHGSNVLSVLAANLPGVMVGTAPEADYYLVRSEDTNGESLLEEYNWVTGAEYADSAGVDIISTSLSYLLSSDPATELSFSQLDGQTAPVTIAADIAATKGMIVVVTAGNNGQNQSWLHVGFPADGDSVLTIGAVDAHGIRAPFSSPGPTYDGRIKPDVMAMGVGTTVMQPDGSVGTGDGTSFSTPIIAGLAACLWQAYPGKTNMEILEAIRMGSNRYGNPDTLMGYGIPDFSEANRILGMNNMNGSSNGIKIVPNPFSDHLTITELPGSAPEADIELLDLAGRCILAERGIRFTQGSGITLPGLSGLDNGLYMLKISSGGMIYVNKVIKHM